MPYANVHGMIKELLDRVRSLEARVTTLEGVGTGSASNDGEPVDPEKPAPPPQVPPKPQDPPEPPPQDPPAKAEPHRHRTK